MNKQLDEIYVIGAGGHGKVAIRAAQECGIRVVAVFDDDSKKIGSSLCGAPVTGNVRSILQHDQHPTLIAIGDNSQRLALADQLKLSWATVVHPQAIVDPSARLGLGALILAGAVVQVDASIGDHAIINDNATVEHDCHVAAGAHVGCNACLTGGARVGLGGMIGAGAVVLPNVSVGDSATIGAGSVVTKNVSENETVAGSPARLINCTSPRMSSPAAEKLRNKIYLSPPHMSQREREFLLDAFDSNWIAPLGPHVDAFEREFAATIGTGHAVALSSGTAALHLALLAVGVQPGDTVLTSTLTFIATVNAIRHAGATPVFLDSEWQSWNLDPKLLEEELKSCAASGCLPTAVVVVDVFGQCADYDSICAICGEFGIPIVEDAAEALGATFRGRRAGAMGDIGCFSFNGNKIITTSGGGMLVTENGEWARQVRHLATQARLPGSSYVHDQVGFNYRLSNLLAAIGRGQLSSLGDRVERRRRNFETYKRALGELPGIQFMPEYEGSRATRWLTCILVDPDKFGCTAEEIRQHLESENIESRRIWKPMHLQPVNQGCRVRGGPVAEAIFERGLCLPSGSNLSAQEQARIIQSICQCAGRNLMAEAA